MTKDFFETQTAKFKRGFGSDNHSGIHPKILEAILQVNAGHTASYQTDPISAAAVQEFKKHFGEATQVYFCFNGTAANVLGLSQITEPHQTVLVSSTAHLEHDECGAPERVLGLRVRTVPCENGKLTPLAMQEFLIRRGDQHFSQVAAISVTQPTEFGTVYSLAELQDIVAFAREHQLKLHMDGARLANAVVSLKSTFAQVTEGFDIISFGGTKNGLMGGEAILVLNEKSTNLKYTRKQLMQLPSKTRFIAAQFLAYFENENWKQIAEHSCSMAQKLRQAIEKKTKWQITQATDSNAVFVKIPKEQISALREKSFFYVWNEKTFECRLMTSWDTGVEEIEGFVG